MAASSRTPGRQLPLPLKTPGELLDAAATVLVPLGPWRYVMQEAAIRGRGMVLYLEESGPADGSSADELDDVDVRAEAVVLALNALAQRNVHPVHRTAVAFKEASRALFTAIYEESGERPAGRHFTGPQLGKLAARYGQCRLAWLKAGSPR